VINSSGEEENTKDGDGGVRYPADRGHLGMWEMMSSKLLYIKTPHVPQEV
jgi:hypothetical protein